MFRRAGRRFGVAAAVTTAVMVVLQGILIPAAYAAPSTTCTSMTLAQVQARILSETNAARAKVGRPALKASTAINSVAVAWSEKQAAANAMSHNPYYSKQIPSGWSAAGENVAYGYAVANVTKAWLASSGHRANIERSTFTHIGIGVACSSSGRPYYTQVFGGYKTTPGIPPTPTNVNAGLGIESARITWSSANYTDARALTGFTITASPGGKSVTVGATTRAAVITGLTGGVAYKFTVKGVNRYGTSVAATSPTVTAIPSVTNETANTAGTTVLPTVAGATPTLGGTAKVGYRITAAPGTWTAGTALSYQWYIAGVPISGATAATFAPRSSDIGKRVQVTVTGRLDGYGAARTVSGASAAIVAGTLSAPAPTVAGTAKAGLTLTARPGTWTTGTSLRYQWYAAGKAVSGATKATFVPGTAQIGKAMAVRVTGVKSGYTTVAKTSKTTATVAKFSTLTASTPSITGTRSVGQTLTAKPNTWTAGTTFYYQWFRSGIAVTGATTSTYAVTAADRGRYLTVRVTGRKAGYITVVKMSAQTAVIS